MGDHILRHLLAGFVRLHVLYHADKEPICGVEIMEELRHHGYKIGPGTLYPILHDLLQSGHLSCSDEVVAGKRRKNFRVTASGRKVLAEARLKLRELASEIIDDKDARVIRPQKPRKK
jgi:DNA-binding PadR family transcriptional regulator